MQEVHDQLQLLFKQVSVKINKNPQSFQPFIKVQNWFETPQSLGKVTDQQFLKMNIPLGVVNTIRQILASNQNTQQNQNQNYFPYIDNNPLAQLQVLYSKVTMAMIISLDKQCDYNQQEANKILRKLVTIIENIIKYPDQQKYRTLKKSNQAIYNIFWQHDSCMQFIIGVGFQNNQQILYLPKINDQKFFSLQTRLLTIKKYLPDNTTILQQNTNSNQNHNNSLANFNWPLSNNPEQQIQKKIYSQALQKLIDYRTKIMSSVQFRKLKIYQKKDQEYSQVQQFDFRTQLSQTTDIEVLKYWKIIIESNEKGLTVQNQRKQQFQFLLNSKLYKEAKIKVRLPNQYIIEGYFGPLEKLKAVFDWLCDIVIGDMYLYTTPPVKKMVKQLQMTLDALDCVPNGTFYLGFNGPYSLKQQYLQLVIK